MWNWCKAALIAAVLCPAPAFAQTQPLAGAWDFRAVFKEIGCTISGEATLTATSVEGTYDVALNAVETCGSVAEAPVGQACVARQQESRVAIRCRIVQIAPERSYLPDDFDLVVQDASTMGGLLTANWNAPAVWRRRAGAPVV